MHQVVFCILWCSVPRFQGYERRMRPLQALSTTFGYGISLQTIGHYFRTITRIYTRGLGMDSHRWMALYLSVADTPATPALHQVSDYTGRCSKFERWIIWSCLTILSIWWNKHLYSHLTDADSCQSQPSGTSHLANLSKQRFFICRFTKLAWFFQVN